MIYSYNLSQSYFSDYAVQNAWAAPLGGKLAFVGTITASPLNTVPIQLRSSENSGVTSTLSPGEYVQCQVPTDLSKIQFQCATAGQVAKIQGNVDSGY